MRRLRYPLWPPPPSPSADGLMKTPVACHPLPQGGEGPEFSRPPLEIGWLDRQREKEPYLPRIAGARAAPHSQPEAICFGHEWRSFARYTGLLPHGAYSSAYGARPTLVCLKSMAETWASNGAKGAASCPPTPTTDGFRLSASSFRSMPPR